MREETNPDVEGYPEYRRREPSHTVQVWSAGRQHTVDSQWVVPYNPFLLKTFNCHINVEISTSIRAVKYLFKYVFKGPDAVALSTGAAAMQDSDEIANYIDARYVSACEGGFCFCACSSRPYVRD